jgi:DNA-binding NarL/FixJ family response regulator
VHLTDRQREVLALMMQGKSNKHICRELGLAEATVKIHVTAILRGLKVTSRAQAIVAVNQLGLTADSLPLPATKN